MWDYYMKTTALVRMTIDEIAKQKNIPLETAFDLAKMVNLK